MKGKKILSVVLSAAMLISCITVGSGSVVQASGESRTVGNNIARNLRIVAYSGQESDTHPIGAVNDGVKTDNNDHQRWQSKENLKGTTSTNRGNAAYIIFDLGDENVANSVRSFSQIKVKFHNFAYATDYQILTSDTCEIATEDQLPKGKIPNGWTELIHKQHTGTSAFPEDVLEGKTENVGRYLMFFFTAMNSGAGIDSVSVREIEIYNNPVTGVTMSQESANLTVDGTLELTATVNPADATQTAVQWSTDNADVATVDQNGNVTAVAPGEAVITATSKDNKSKNASCTVTVKPSVNKDELTKVLEEANSLNQKDYTPESWVAFNDAKVGATEVHENTDATQAQVNDAVKAVRETMSALERVYTVTVNGQEKARGVYNHIVTITADAPEAEMKFAGWQLNGKIVSYDATYTFAIAGDMDFTATYAQEEEVITKPLYAAVANTAITKRADGKANVKYVAQLSIPEGYTLNEAGLLWYGKSDLASLTTENGPAAGVKKIATSTINTRYQFAIRVNGIPAGKTIRGVIYAKVTNNETQETTWVYSEEVKLTNN